MQNLHDNFAEAKRRLPLPQLMERCGLGEHAKKSARCPWHEDGNNSFSVWQGEKGWQFKCFSGCGGGNEVAFLEKHFTLSNKEAFKRYLDMAGVGNQRTTSTTNTSKVASAAQPMNWRAWTHSRTPTLPTLQRGGAIR